MAVPLRRNHEYVALWVGQTASALGTSVSTIAYPLLVLALTGSAALAGLVGTVSALTSFLLRLPLSVVADRVNAKKLMLLCDGGRVVAVGSLAIACALDQVTMVHIIGVAVCEAVFGVLFAPAEVIAVRQLVPREQLGDALATNQSRQQVASLVGPTLSGFLLTLGRSVPFLVDSLSYLVSFWCITRVKSSRTFKRGVRGRIAVSDFLSGMSWLWDQPMLRVSALWLGVISYLFASLGLVTIVYTTDLGASTAQIGLTVTIAGLGGLAGALVAPCLVRSLHARTIVMYSTWLLAGSTCLLLLVDEYWQIGLVRAIAFFAFPAANACIAAEVASRAPDELQGRAAGASAQIVGLLQPLGPLTIGLLIEALGLRTTISAYSVVLICLSLLAPICLTLGPRPSRSRSRQDV